MIFRVNISSEDLKKIFILLLLWGIYLLRERFGPLSYIFLVCMYMEFYMIIYIPFIKKDLEICGCRRLQ